MTVKKRTLEILSDLEWHCACELPSSQPAATIRDLKNEGYSFWVNEAGNRWVKNIHCDVCNASKPHRKLLSLEKTDNFINRVNFTPAIRKRVLDMFDSKDILTGGTVSLEVDHRVTPNRNNGGEAPLPKNVSDEELFSRYMILTRVNNHIKREACNKCKLNDKRQPSITGIDFFYEGTSKYEGTCKGCFWAYPEEWRKGLNKRLNS